MARPLESTNRATGCLGLGVSRVEQLSPTSPSARVRNLAGNVVVRCAKAGSQY